MEERRRGRQRGPPKSPSEGLAKEVREKHSRSRSWAKKVCVSSCRQDSSKNAGPGKQSGTGGFSGASYSLNGLPSDL